MSISILAENVANAPALRVAGAPGRPTLLFLHGAFVTHEPWRPWLARLGARGWPGLAVARRGRLGFGPSQAKGLRFQDYLEDTLRVIDTLDQPPVLVGHSSLLPPAGACRRLVLNRMPESEHGAAHGSLVHESGAVYRDLMLGAVHVDPARVRCPTIVLSGEHDHVISTALARFTAKRYGATLEIYPEHAHWILGEPGWEKVADRVVAWLAETCRAEVEQASGQRA